MLVLLAACHHAPTPRLAEPTPGWVGTTNATGELPAVVARIGDLEVTREEFEASDPALLEAKVAFETARYDAMNGLVADRLVTAAATAAGQDPATWFEAEVARRVTPATEAQIVEFYTEHSHEVGGMSLDEAHEPIRSYLEGEARGDAAGAILRELRKAGDVRIFLPDRFRVAVDAADGARLGSPAAPVQIVEFSDFQCPYCAKAAEVVHEVAAAYPDQVSVVFRHFPLPSHTAAPRAAEASECAREQGEFWAYHDHLFANQADLRGEAAPDLTLARFAEELKLDGARFRECLESGRHAGLVAQDLDVGQRVGTTGTPSFYVNGIPLGGAQPFEAFADLVDAELARLSGLAAP